MAAIPRVSESADLDIAEGRAEGDAEGRFRGLSHPLLLEIRGYGRAYPRGRRQIVAASTRISDVERYRRLNDILWVGVGEVRTLADGDTELVIDIAELVSEPIAE